MKSLLKIDSILFYVRNLKKSSKFYENVLGLKRVWSDKDAKMIALVFPESDSEIVIHSDKNIPNPSFSFLVKDVEAFCKACKKKGYKILEEPFGVRTGKFAVISDIDGNAIPIIDLTKFNGKPRYDL